MATKSQLIDLDGLKVFKESYDLEVDEKIASAGTTVTKESIIEALEYTPADENDIPSETTVSGWGFTKNTGDYTKPATGIPSSDLSSDVQSSLSKADSALQSFTESDPTVPSHVKSITSQNISDWNAKSDFSGSYNDLEDKPESLPASDVSAWAKADTKPSYTASEVGALADTVTHLSGDIASTEKGANNGVATLGSDGKVPSSQLPSYVDDVLEYSAKSEFPAEGESGKIYIDTATNITYRWSGSAYVAIGSDLALGETSSTAYAGDKGKANADAISSHTGNADIHVTSADKSAWSGKQDALTEAQLSAVNSGITKSKVDAIPSSYAPVNAQANVIETVKVNNTAVTVTDKTVNITVPTQASDIGALPDTTVIPAAVTESTVSGWGFTKSTGTYSKPSGGIPKTDLASAVQTSLGKADTALQSFTETDPVFVASAAHGITSTDISNWNAKSNFSGSYNDLSNKPSIPTVTDTYSSTSGDAMSGKAVASAMTGLKWVGTEAEYQAQKNSIPAGTIVITTDDAESNNYYFFYQTDEPAKSVAHTVWIS